MADAKIVMELRNRTGAGVVDCKNALDEAGGDIEKAIEVLKKSGAAKAAKKSAERTTSEGVVAVYLHHTKKLAAMVEVQCETDFVARNAEFIEFGNDVAMQIAAMSPEFISPEDIPTDMLEKKRQIFMEEIKEEKKPDDIKIKIVEGKLNKWMSEVCLTKQDFLKNEDMTIEQLVAEKIAKIGEKIQITRMVRYEMSPSSQVC